MGGHGPAIPDDVAAGQNVYSPLMLRLYDFGVLGLSNRFVWRCHTRNLLRHYDRHVGARHLDVGVGTGYFLDRCRFPTQHPQITLADLNPNSLNAAAQRISRYAPRTRQVNVLEPLDFDERFDSIGINFLLHCLPGAIDDKAVVFANLRPLLAAGGVLFGSTVLGSGVSQTPLSRGLMRFYNRKGIFTNLDDSLNGLDRALEREFARHDLEVCGSVAIFSASSA